MHFLLRWTRKFQQAGWSVGFCSTCQQPGPSRVDDVVEVFSINLIPLSREIVGRVRRCDFCERPIDTGKAPPDIAFDEWSHDQGLGALVRRVAPAWESKLHDRSSRQRLISPLSAAQARSTINSVDVVPGMTVGVLVGIVFAVVAAVLMYGTGDPRPAAGPQPMRPHEVLWILGPPVAGLILGPLAHILYQRRRIPLEMIGRACHRYKVDFEELRELAPNYAARIRRAVELVTGELGHESPPSG